MSLSKLSYDPKKVCAHHIRGNCRNGDKCFKMHLLLEVFFAGATMSHNLEARGGDPTKIGTNDTNFALKRQDQLDAEKRIQQTPGFENFKAKNMHLWDDQERIDAEKAHVDEMIKQAKQAEEAEQAEEDIQDEFDAFVAEGIMHLERANALPKGETEWADLMVAPGAPKKEACSVAKYLADHKGRELFPADEFFA